MIFSHPVPFSDALASRAVKAILPTTASSAQLARLPADIRERSLFSARTPYASHLATIDHVINRILNPAPAAPGEYMNEARARQALRASLADFGYDPVDIDATPGSLKDLASESRIHVIIDTQVKMARGYGNWAQGQEDAILDEWPAQEFLRVESRDNPRADWPSRFEKAGGTLTDDIPPRMVALKNTPVWTNLSRFGLPYPPFDYLSGMGVEDIDRDEAIALGLIDRDTRVEPQTRAFNADLAASIPPTDNSALLASITAAMGDQVDIDEYGVLHFLTEPGPLPF